MADRGDTHFHVPTLNKWFLVSSVLLLGTVVWTVIDDWAAEWKAYQREFRKLDLEQAQASLETLEREGALALEVEFLGVVDKARASLDLRRQQLEEAEDAAYAAKEARYRIEEQFKSSKAIENWDKYKAEEEALLEPDVGIDEAEDSLEGVRMRTTELAYELEQKNAAYDAAEKEVSRLRADIIEAEKALAAGTRELARVRKKIEQLDPSEAPVRVANAVRDFPGLDFVGPSLMIQKYVLDDLTFELNFTKKTRIDMCTTCHMGMEREGFEDADQPYTTHPRLDLYLSSKSPHPVKDIGCTICHRGSGESLSFQHADHRPSDPAEAIAWRQEYHWEKQHHWDYPMLESQRVEASCVQCHKTSMELIADDAPTVSEGYRLVEEYGCYSCHKIDWFPTTRKRGPSLKNLQAKLTSDFVDPWIAAPRDFRPTTRMPQVFHLENYPEDEPVVTSNYGEGPEILGQAWNDTAVASITKYLFANHPEQELDPIPVDGDPDRGREVFRLVGCLACHNMAPYPGEETAYPDLAFGANDTNSYGPNLRGVATKINERWLYHWLKNPTEYWPETRMPDLRLSDQDAADIARYLTEDPDGVFTDVPDAWSQGHSPVDLAALQEQARWFYQKEGRAEIERRLAGENPDVRWDDPEVLEVAVGEAFVRQQGCFSCHEIGGMEEMMPIGTELTNWGSKTVDKLDFGMAYRKEIAGRPKLDHHYREGWLERKLHHPRSFDIDKIKNPKEKLKMPWFDFSDEEVDAITTFMLGLVDDEVQLAKMVPTPDEHAANVGMRVVRQKNCRACHMTDPGTVTFDHEGELVTAAGEIMPLDGETLPPPMRWAALQDAIESWEDYEEEELEEIIVRLLAPTPAAGAPSETVVVPADDLVAVTPPHGGDFIRLVNDYYFFGANIPDPEAGEDEDPWYGVTYGYDEDSGANLIEDVDGVQRAYEEEQYDKIRWTFAPPVLWNEGHKVQRAWFYAFLEDPWTLRKQIRVRMPSFHFAPGEAEAVADYFAFKARQEWYPRFARTARLVLGRPLKPALADQSAHAWPLELKDEWPTGALMTSSGPSSLSVEDVATAAGLAPSVVAAIEAGSRPDIAASFDKLESWARGQGFDMVGPVSESYEQIERRSPSYLAERGDFIDVGFEVADKGVNCFQCHPRAGVYPETPIAWAPDLVNAHERLREDWVQEWLWSPTRVYPGTAMPDNFAADTPQYQDVYPNSPNGAQIQAVMDWLFNLDRAPAITD